MQRITYKPSGSRSEELSRLEPSFNADDEISQLKTADLDLRLEAETTAPSGFTVTPVDETLLFYTYT